MMLIYLRNLFLLFLLLFLPMIFFRPSMVLESNPVPEKLTTDLSYSKIELADFDANGYLLFMLSAESMYNGVDGSLLFQDPALEVLDSDSHEFIWNITAKKCVLDGSLMHFIGDVKIREQSSCPIEIDASNFVYDKKQNTFIAEGSVEYRKARSKILAKRAQGVLNNSRIRLAGGTSTYNPAGKDCTS